MGIVPAVAHRKRLLVIVVATVLVAAVAAWIVLPGRSSDATARAAAERYVGYIASGDEDDLERLWAMSTSETPGAMRSAVELLDAAAARIEVVSIDDPHPAEAADVPFEVQLEDLVEMKVHYRLAGEEHEWPIVLGKQQGENGRDLGDWRVVTPLMGSIAWDQPGFADVGSDLYVGSVRQVRRPALIGVDEDLQPLFPAVYRTQVRLDPYFASAEKTVAVTAGAAVAPPDLRTEPTQKTQAAIRRAVWRSFASCGRIPYTYPVCPLEDLVQSRGVDVYSRGWWRGLTERPTVTVDGDGAVTLSGGAFRFRGPDGVRELRFTGTGNYGLDNQSWTPALFELVAGEAP